MKHGCNQMKIFQRDYFGMKRIFTKRMGEASYPGRSGAMQHVYHAVGDL